jgi:hypothetical protein
MGHSGIDVHTKENRFVVWLGALAPGRRPNADIYSIMGLSLLVGVVPAPSCRRSGAGIPPAGYFPPFRGSPAYPSAFQSIRPAAP